MPSSLTDDQERALRYVAARSSGPSLDAALHVTINFHPDRRTVGVSALELIGREGCFRSQFETGTSSGGLTAHSGGDRWRWESRIFGAAYDTADPGDRPKYAALNYRSRDTGGSPRFGSACLRLNRAVLRRCTFCFPDSAAEPLDFGVEEHMPLIAKALAADVDLLDDYVEAQVHGSVDLEHDVEALVLDPCYRGTAIEQVAGQLPCRLEWHSGFSLSTNELAKRSDYRGRDILDLGFEVAEDTVINARVIGDAANTGRYPEQRLKKLWHCVARFGVAP